MAKLKKDFKSWEDICRKPTETEIIQITKCLNNYYKVTRKSYKAGIIACSVISAACFLAFHITQLQTIPWLCLGSFIATCLYYITKGLIQSYQHIINAMTGDFQVVNAKISYIQEDYDDEHSVLAFVRTENERGQIGPFQIRNNDIKTKTPVTIIKFTDIDNKYMAFTPYMLEAETYLENLEVLEYTDFTEDLDDLEEQGFTMSYKEKKNKNSPVEKLRRKTMVKSK